MDNHLPALWSALRRLVPPIRALSLAAAVGIMLGNVAPVAYLQQAAGPLTQLSSSLMAGH